MASHGFRELLLSIPWFAWVAMVAIVCGSINRAVYLGHRHRERMEMIRQGMNPDGGKSTQPEL